MKHKGYDYSFEDWKIWCIKKNHPPFTAMQIYQWIFNKRILDPKIFSNLSLTIRNELFEEFDWNLPSVDSHLVSRDTSEKFLLKTHDNLAFEMVLMPYDNRATLCISSQVGCKIGCTFCQTGKMGFKRNLSSGEIVSQIILANEHLKKSHTENRTVTNIVFMGMGEPLDNYDNVVKACKIMIDPSGFNLSHTKVTISTSGLVPEIRKLAKDLPVRLAISLHQADDEKRSLMMPINRTYNLQILKEALLEYPASKRYGITFEYVMIEGKNDSIQDAKKLVRFLHGLKAKVNLIPVNPFPGIEMQASGNQKLREFQSYLADRSIPAPVRYSRGPDISGACGQLAAKREDEIHLDPREVSRRRREESRNEAVSLALLFED